MVTEIILYTSGVITTVSVIGFVHYRDKYKKLVFSSSYIEKEYSQLIKEKKEKESSKRLAKYKTTGWHFTKDSSDPQKKTWDVYFELKEAAVSVDEKKIKFDVLSVVSQGDDDTWKQNQYADWFYKKTGGGWLSIDNTSLEWITTLSKSEARDIKLKELGI